VKLQHRLRPYLALAILALIFFLPGQASLPPLDRDESRYTQATVQMLESGAYLDIRFQDQPRYLQPAGIYWLQATAVSLLSSPEAREVWAYRVPSLIGAVLAVLLTALIGNILFGAPAGFIAAVLMVASVMLGAEARMGKIDAVLLATVLAAQTALARIYLEPAVKSVAGKTATGVGPPTRWVAAFWLALGCGLMLKGPIILLVVGGTILLLLAIERRGAWLRRLRPAWGVPLMLAVVLPWFVAIYIVSHGAFFSTAVGHNLLDKVTHGHQSHGAPPGYYLALFPLTFWPGTLFAAFALPFAWANRRSPAVRFCLCWIAPTWVVFELVATKLPHYVLPVYPAVACLAAAGLVARDKWDFSRWGARLYWALAAIWLIVGVGLAGAPVAAVWWLEGTLTLVGVLTVIAAVPMIVATPWLLRRGRTNPAIACAASAALIMFVSAYAYQLPRLETIWMSPRIVAAVARAKPCPETTVGTVPYVEPSLVFLLGTATKLGSVQDVAEHLLRDPACALALVGAEERNEFLSLMTAGNIQPREVDRIRGINYSNGKKLELTLYAASPSG
jgi:4-amino-4-deoxy-L-arabinose transferase-like glycosyltransferase